MTDSSPTPDVLGRTLRALAHAAEQERIEVHGTLGGPTVVLIKVDDNRKLRAHLIAGMSHVEVQNWTGETSGYRYRDYIGDLYTMRLCVHETLDFGAGPLVPNGSCECPTGTHLSSCREFGTVREELVDGGAEPLPDGVMGIPINRPRPLPAKSGAQNKVTHWEL